MVSLMKHQPDRSVSASELIEEMIQTLTAAAFFMKLRGIDSEKLQVAIKKAQAWQAGSDRPDSRYYEDDRIAGLHPNGDPIYR